jgi:hexokinase
MHPNTYASVILGTGTNAAYVEKVCNIPKLKGHVKDKEMIINTEWGTVSTFGLEFLHLIMFVTFVI